jgi:glycosyltransferase involved in cell wall biosynthesis
VGRLIRAKGIDVLLAAVPLMAARFSMTLTIVGDGPEREALRRQSAGLPVAFAGSLGSPVEVADFLRSIDIFVMPSRWEGRPNALLEALACGVRVVATDAPGVAEAVGNVGTLVPRDDPIALANGVCEAIALPAPPYLASRSFDDTALDHLSVFERAYQTRRRRRLGMRGNGAAYGSSGPLSS